MTAPQLSTAAPARREVAPVLRGTAVGTAPLDVDAVRARVADPRSGAVVVFEGVVRDHDGGRSVTMIEYEAHPSAADVLAAAAATVAESAGPT